MVKLEYIRHVYRSRPRRRRRSRLLICDLRKRRKSGARIIYGF
jgi:hypothetical protein